MTQVDQAQLLGDLPPHVRDEVLRRVAVIKRYIADKSRANAEACAAELGLGVVHFKKLVHVWELHGRADRLPGAEWPKTKSVATTAEQLAILKEASEAAPADTVEAVVRVAAGLAAARGVKMPSRGTMRDRVIELRQRDAPEQVFGHDCHLVVLYAALDLPIEVDGTPTMPVAALAVDPGTRQVLGIGLSPDGPDPLAAAAALRDAAGRLPITAASIAEAGRLRIAMDALPGPGWPCLIDALSQAGAEVAGEKRSAPRRDLATAYLGRRVGGIDVKPRFATRPAADRKPYIESGQVALTLGQALDFAYRRMIPAVRPAASGPAIDRLHKALDDWIASAA